MTRSSQKTGVRRAPVSIRLSESERATLLAKAGGTPISTYVKSVLFGADAASTRRNARRVTADGKLLGKALALLGKAGLADSLSRLAAMAELGILYCNPELLEQLRYACDDVHKMRMLLMRALGKEPPVRPLGETFQSAVSAPATSALMEPPENMGSPERDPDDGRHGPFDPEEVHRALFSTFSKVARS